MTLRLQILIGVVAATAAAAAAVALWAAESRRHWFWRLLAVWGCAAAMLPISACEPALVLGLALPAIALGVRALRWRKERRQAASWGAAGPQRTWRFTLRDFGLALTGLALFLGVVGESVRQIRASHDWLRPEPTVREIILPAVVLGVLSCLGWYVFRRWQFRSLLGSGAAVVGCTFALWPHVHWLYVLEDKLDNAIDKTSNKLFSAQPYLPGFLATLIGLSEFLLFLAALTWAGWACRSRTRTAHAARYALLGVLAAGLPALYGLMLWRMPFPPRIAGDPGQFVSMLRHADHVQTLMGSALSPDDLKKTRPSSTQEASRLLDELLSLLESPSALPEDFTSAEARRTYHQSLIDYSQSSRVLAKWLETESRSAAASGDLQRAVRCALGIVQLGTAFCRNGLMVHDLIGRSQWRQGYGVLCSLRRQIDPAAGHYTVARLASLEASWEPVSSVVQRDLAFSERLLGWQCRLSNLVQRLTEGDPVHWENFRSYTENRATWVAINRLLQVDLALRIFQAERGRLPASLQELAAAAPQPVPLDPCTDQPFIYRPSSDGQFVLYSAGHDRTDNGGNFTNFSTYSDADRAQGYDLDLDTLTRP